MVQEVAHPDANIIFGAVIDDALGDEARVTVIAAGFDSVNPETNSNNTSAANTQAARTQQSFGGVSAAPTTAGNGFGTAPAANTWNGSGADIPTNAGFDVDLPPVVEDTQAARRDTLDVPDFLK